MGTNTKKALREAMMQRRLALSPAEVTDRSQRIARRLFTLPSYQEAGFIMTYVSFRHEVETAPIIRAALEAGKRVAVPYTNRQEKKLLPLEIIDFPGELAPGQWGILEPRPEVWRPVNPHQLQLIIVPGLAFDAQGNRLGYGGGYYDRFLPPLAGRAMAVALAYDFQVYPRLCCNTYDYPVDMVITEHETIKCQSRAGCES